MKQKSSVFLSVFVLMLFATTGRPFAVFKSNPPPLPTIPAWPTKSHRPPWRFAPEPTITPRPIAQGSQTYTAFMGSGLEGPRMRKFIINPHDPQVGKRQTIRVCIVDENVIYEARVSLQTDNASRTYQLSLVKGKGLYKRDECEDEWWEGSWKIEDTHDVNYVLTFEAVSNTGLSRTDLSIR